MGSLPDREQHTDLAAYLLGRLDGPAHARFEAHLAGCPHCTAYLEQIRETVALTGAIAPEELSPEAQRALQGVFAAWARGS